jgi:hypothetical protein
VSAAPRVDITYTPVEPTPTQTQTQTTPVTTPPVTTPPVTTGTAATATLGTIAQGADGSLTLTMKVTGGGVLEALASYSKKAAGNAAALRLAKGQLLYARAKKTVKAGTVKLKLKPTKAAKKVLRKKKVLSVKIVTPLTPKTGKAVTKTKTVKVRVKKSSIRSAGRAA